MRYIKPTALTVLILLTLGAPGQTDLGNATAGQAIMQMALCMAGIALIARPKVVMLYGYQMLLGLRRTAQVMPRDVRTVRR